MDEYSAEDYEDVYGKTPPRTKILRKNRQRTQREKQVGTMSSPKPIKAKVPISRRNTISTLFDELIAKEDNADTHQNDSKRSNKRHMKLLRGSERDLKLDIVSAQAAMAHRTENGQEFVETPQPSFQIETSKRFKSLSCRTIPCFKRAISKLKHDDKADAKAESIIEECPQSRVEFYQTFSMLIRMGCGDRQTQDRNPRRVMSREETVWQNEFKDLIWLELQAYHADKTPIEEDNYLCCAREGVEPLLKDIMTYKFCRHSRRFSTQNSDSGVEDDCPGCLSMYCLSCLEAQSEALRDIDDLMQRLEDAEALFPSSKAFAEIYPLYNSPAFVGRVKAISLWYNMTRHQRLKLRILAKLLALLENKQYQWPLLTDDCESENGSPSESNNSTTSSVSDFLSDGRISDNYNMAPLAMLMSQQNNCDVSPYRRYIENVLKTRALHKSLSFLDKLHVVLKKAQLTLERPENEEVFSKVCFNSDDDELKRYGCWSPEAQALDLPSYRSCFIFLASVPLDVIHEYLLMRLDQKPENPSPLCVRQLMRELKEGLRIASSERQKIKSYIQSAISGTKDSPYLYDEKLKAFDDCMLRVFGDYLGYVEHWALLNHETFQKNLLEEEFQFSLEITKVVTGGTEVMGNKFLQILGTMVKRIGERVKTKIEDLLGTVPKDDVNLMKQTLFSVCRELQTLFNDEREMTLKTMAFFKTIIKHDLVPTLDKSGLLRDSVLELKSEIWVAISKVQVLFDLISEAHLDEIDRGALNGRIREILMLGYRFGFEFYKEMSLLIPNTKGRDRFAKGMIRFAKLWMQFVTERCERGRGMRPRWAYQGLEFLITVCEPNNTKHLTEEEFEDLKANMDACISHVIGTTAPSTPDSGFISGSPRTSIEHIRARSRGSSPSPRPTYKSQRSNASRKTSMEQSSPGLDNADGVTFNRKEEKSRCSSLVQIKLPPSTHSDRCREAVETLETEIDDNLRKQGLIGKVLCNIENKTFNRRRNVTFSWQRGIKIGQGRFGKVYTAVNIQTGEMMAVKEIALQHNDTLAVKRVLEEMKILEGIVHRNLVKYYGVEIHKDEMLIFMEFCEEGTLENLVAATEGGLPELLVRRYTFQLVSGVMVLHDHGIVHRDIKTANIFLTDDGNCLKIGDFGCAAKIKFNTTMPGELKGFVGTQAYMAPEVFTKNMNEGHGRAADIWSVGCCVVEMASGKRPWAQFDSNYQIMFKVGMGQSPDPPDDMIDEGLDFLHLCFKHDPRDRATAHELIEHSFVKVVEDLI